MAQTKEKSYHDQHPIDQMLLLTIEVLECLHKQVDVFLHNYACYLELKRARGSPLFILVTFF